MRTNFLPVGLIVTFAFLRIAALTAAQPRSQSGAEARVAPESGTAQGKVLVTGHQQKLKPLPVFKNRSFCGASVRNETLLIRADGGLENAVVIFRPLGRTAVFQPRAIALDNRQCAFTPHVQVALVGSEVLLKNSDPILHTVHARLGNETLFNVGLPKWRQVVKRLGRAGVIKINCDVLHTWMSAAIVITESPFFALTDAAGDFKVDSLPAGEYDVEVWHERLGSRRQRVVVRANSVVSLDVVYALDQSS